MKKKVILESHILKEYVPRNRINAMPQNGDFFKLNISGEKEPVHILSS